MIEKEEISIKRFRTGVTFYIFSSTIYENAPENPDEYGGPYPSYVLYDNSGIVTSINKFDGNSLWTRNGNNNYVQLSSVTSNYYMTGHSIVTRVDSNLTDDQINARIDQITTRLTDTSRFPSAWSATNFVFYTKDLIDDFMVDIKLERSYNSLDTLKVYNNLVNSLPDQEAKTGVVFGRLMAIQKLKNENGQNIRIPLKNVPIGMFNPSETFPQLFSTDENGDRLSLNLKESSLSNEYFDTISYDQDHGNYLRSGEAFSAVPAQYKYVTKTNENGEFILYDIPVGQQTAILEVDLFKQGLTKDEIALNFFPFPTTEEPNIDTIPSFVYKQFPIDVVPAWGLSQTGYTSLDININLDLRKWATYIIPPVSFAGEKLDQTTAKNPTRTLKVEVRDMTATNFVRNPLEIIQIPDDLSRDVGAQYLWFDEFAQRKKKIEFNQFGCNVFKLPANIFDPNGYRTDMDGVPTGNKGVWLAAYQFKVYIDGTVQRTTGAYSYWNGTFYTRDHFHLNNVVGNDTAVSTESAPAQIGTFPYEKPWSATYPEPYSIPKKPTAQRFSDGTGRMLHPSSTPGNPIYYYEEPSYSDGDLVGAEVGGSSGPIAGGFGIQNQGPAWFYNRIANVATKNWMYKYEKGVAWSETYANNYEPYWDATNNPFGTTDYPFVGVSNVVGGEKYQRVECGYGYFIRPQGWGRVGRTDWAADINFDTAYLNTSDPNNPGPASRPPGIAGNWFSHRYTNLTMYNLDNQNLTLALNLGSVIKEGTLDLYRIVESGIDNIVEPTNFVIPTYVVLHVEGSNFAWRMFIKNSGDVPVSFRNSFNPADGYGGAVTYTDYLTGNVVTVGAGGLITLGAGYECQTVALGANTTIGYTATQLPGNASYNSSTNKYDSAIYTINVTYYRNSSPSNYQLVGGDTTVGATMNGSPNVYGTQQWFVRTVTNGGSYGLVHEGITKDFFYGSTYYNDDGGISLYGLRLEAGSSLWGTFNDGSNNYGFGYYVS